MPIETPVDVNTNIIDGFTKRALRLQQTLAAAQPSLPNIMRRGAHPKHHGLVRAEFVVTGDVPPQFRHGLFAEPGSFRAYVRFSNSGSEMDDSVKDAHGMAIKLFGVPGRKLLPDEQWTHDFLLVDAPVFVAKSPEAFFELMQLGAQIAMTKAALEAATKAGQVADVQRLTQALTTLGQRMNHEFPNVDPLKKVIPNPLTVPYFSQTAYALGPLAVKYQMRPTVIDTEMPEARLATVASRTDFLAAAMVETLQDRAVTFDFLVQPGDGSTEMPVNDPTVAWPETRSPFVKVATLTIPRQTFTAPEQQAFAEKVSFNPWHARPEHTPLERVNESRRDVYLAMLSTRQAANGFVAREPDGTTDF